MSRKQILEPFYSITDGNMTGNITGEPTHVKYIDRIQLQFIWEGDGYGTFGAETSLDYNPPLVDAASATWTPMVFTPTPAAAGEDGNGTIDITETSIHWIRATYEADSGDGYVSAIIAGKES